MFQISLVMAEKYPEPQILFFQAFMITALKTKTLSFDKVRHLSPENRCLSFPQAHIFRRHDIHEMKRCTHASMWLHVSLQRDQQTGSSDPLLDLCSALTQCRTCSENTDCNETTRLNLY